MDPRIQTVMSLMENSFGHDLALQQMAKLVNLSSPRLRHLCKAETGTTPSRHLHAVRLQRAKELLETTFLSVKQITAAVGLHSESHLVTDFRRAYGLTPAQYRATRKHILIEHNDQQC